MTERGEGAIVTGPFRGERTYLHTADILAGLVAATGATANLRLVLTAPADCAIELSAVARQPAPGARICGRFSHVANGITRRYRLLLRPDLPVLTHVSLDEEAFVEGAVIEGDHIAAPASSAGGFVERLIGLAIELLMSRYPDDYWRLGELELAYLPPESAAIDCLLMGSVGKRFWQCGVLVDERLIGRLLLALAPQPNEPAASSERP